TLLLYRLYSVFFIFFLFFFYRPGPHLHLHSFPTRRSSDLPTDHHRVPDPRLGGGSAVRADRQPGVLRQDRRGAEHRRRTPGWRRSEEHTSELQSRSDLVCRLLLEKKKHQLLHRPTQAHIST